MGIEMIDLKYVTQKREVFFELAKKRIKPDDRVLDIGAGSGAFADYCEHQNIFLFDGNQETVSKLKERYNNVFLGQLPILPFENGSFNIIHCSHVVEHLEPNMFYNTLKEIDRCLETGGYLVISTPLMWEKFYDDLSHVKPYNPRVFIKYLTNETTGNSTRIKISNKYVQEELIFRTYEHNYTRNFSYSKKTINTYLIMKAINLAYRLGIRKYKKNGYTIVLKKE